MKRLTQAEERKKLGGDKKWDKKLKQMEEV